MVPLGGEIVEHATGHPGAVGPRAKRQPDSGSEGGRRGLALRERFEVLVEPWLSELVPLLQGRRPDAEVVRILVEL